MIKQEITYHPNTYQEASYTEFVDDKLILTKEYDMRGRLIEEHHMGNITYQLYNDDTFIRWYYNDNGSLKYIDAGILMKGIPMKVRL